MRKRESHQAARGVAHDRDGEEAAEAAYPAKRGAGGATPGESLAYLKDLIDELTVMSRRLGAPTLTGLLELALQEAERESRRR